jgi:hypothetical protein
MIAALPYALIGILIIVVAALLARERRPGEPSDLATGQYRLFRPGNGQFMKISDRIFNADDFLWLRDKVARADLARALARSRKQLAIQWLEILRGSFNELVRTPEPTPLPGQVHPAPESWGLLWLTLRFHLLLSYTIFVVRTFGPYHRLLPPLSWRHLLPHPTSAKRRFSTLD